MDTNLSEAGRPARRGVRYRHHPVEFKRAVVEQSLQPGVSVSRLARDHGINANRCSRGAPEFDTFRVTSP
ncbi:transposase [Parazoarcus communis]|uniref:Transposase n=1 Tax=Parazoarcus communis SWub3 = DSM 12120 TaxID=1121029 RepID=A0A323V233_9RHOO|nr:transposase [Parazoarcus communis]NMG72709.1 transposase [Parazoarcus communis SWub3 = DSM 12120]PZA14178.1 hypothetical protein DNK49_23290 [Azoarcus communis] [Parazoarcus communis SWub3 = DSM 12120]